MLKLIHIIFKIKFILNQIYNKNLTKIKKSFDKFSKFNFLYLIMN